jgi:Circadian oscillating protein COP23
MLLKSMKFLLFGTIGLSLCLSNSATMAQSTNSGDVVVPTSSGGDNNSSGTISTSSGSTTTSSNNRFECQQQNGEYTVMYQPQSRPGQLYAWATPRTMGGGWDTARRCQTIAQRLELYRRDGLLELQTGVENNQNVICATTEANSRCRIVLTIPPEKDPYVIRNSVFQNLTTADNGEQTSGVNTYSGRGGSGSEAEQIYNAGRTIFGGKKQPVSSSKSPISLKPFLDKADGGTATSLKNGIRVNRPQAKPPTKNRLNPDKFR